MREPEEEESRGVYVSEGEGGWVSRRKAGLGPLEMLPWVEGCGGPCSSTVRPYPAWLPSFLCEPKDDKVMSTPLCAVMRVCRLVSGDEGRMVWGRTCLPAPTYRHIFWMTCLLKKEQGQQEPEWGVLNTGSNKTGPMTGMEGMRAERVGARTPCVPVLDSSSPVSTQGDKGPTHSGKGTPAPTSSRAQDSGHTLPHGGLCDWHN